MSTRPLYDAVAFLARLGVGVVFIAHGWQKLDAGVAATGDAFDTAGVPLPTIAAVYATFVEMLGGAALIAGLALPVAGALLFVDMAGAFLFVHADQGLFMVDGQTVKNGYELVLVLGLASLLFAAGGGGRLTVDRWVIARRLHRPDKTDDDAASFVDSLRDAEPASITKPDPTTETKPEPAPEKEPEPARKKRRARHSAKNTKPTETPREVIPGSEDDVMVAGAKKAAKRQHPPSAGSDDKPTGAATSD